MGCTDVLYHSFAPMTAITQTCTQGIKCNGNPLLSVSGFNTHIKQLLCISKVCVYTSGTPSDELFHSRKFGFVMISTILRVSVVCLRQPLHGYGVWRARFLIKPLASPPLSGIRQWYQYLFSSAAAAWLSLLSKNAPPECSVGVSRAVNKVFTAQCDRFSYGKKAVNFE